MLFTYGNWSPHHKPDSIWGSSVSSHGKLEAQLGVTTGHAITFSISQFIPCDGEESIALRSFGCQMPSRHWELRLNRGLPMESTGRIRTACYLQSNILGFPQAAQAFRFIQFWEWATFKTWDTDAYLDLVCISFIFRQLKFVCRSCQPCRAVFGAWDLVLISRGAWNEWLF